MSVTGTAVGNYAPDFELPGTRGEVHHLARYLDTHPAVVVVFLGNTCPHSRTYFERLKQLQTDYRDRRVTLIGINANDSEQSQGDRFDDMKALVEDTRLNFPYLRDVTQEVAQSFGASVTPEAFLVDRNGVVRYHGCIDDNPDNPQAIANPYLQTALDRLLQNQPIDPVSTPPVGCPIVWRR
ncbi:thioredoxin family protein [Baaleninema simplex]|uniref:thioredoxin family protein n=1 Tax=Baaleninema simplex TaxID=2862350 RepID=UPI000345AA1B|nr:thioredoxin family protein [Baaleninema simplex]